MRTAILNELKESYLPYSLFWDEWKLYKYNGLTTTDIYIIEVHTKNNFTVSISDFVMFYNQLETLYKLIHKLRETLIEFQDWLISKFQFKIIKYAQGTNLEDFFSRPISGLPLPINLIIILKEFNCKSLDELFKKYSDNDFRKSSEFKTIILFLNYKKSTSRKEVASLNQN